MIFRIEADVSEYQSIVFDIDDYLDVLDPSIGEKQAMFLPMVNLAVAEFWSPIELSYFHNEGTIDLADVSLWKSGLLLMNQKGYDALRDVLTDSGEFLPCELHGKAAYIFNCLELKPENGAKVSYKEKEGWKQSVEAIEFPDGWNGTFCTYLQRLFPIFTPRCPRRWRDKLRSFCGNTNLY